MHVRAPMYTTMQDDGVREGYTLRLSNKWSDARKFAITVEGLKDAALKSEQVDASDGARLIVEVDPDANQEIDVFITAPRASLSVRRARSSSAQPMSPAARRPSRATISSGPDVMADYVNAWQCIGCGKIEAPQPCIGVCKDQRVQFVYAEDYEAAEARAQAAERALDLVRRIAHTHPSENGWRVSYQAFQDEARRIVEQTSVHPDIQTEC